MRSIIGKEWQPPFDDHHPYYHTKKKETHAFWDRHQFPIFTSKRHRFLKYLKFNGAIDEYFLTEYVIYRGFNCCALNPLNFPVNRFGKQLHRKSKFKWISRNYWKEEYWVSEKGICERELRENKIQKNSYRFWIGLNRKNCNI